MPRAGFSDLMKVFNQAEPKECSFPDHSKCRGQIVKAHTIPKSGSLQRIARDGHVYQFRADLALLKRTGGKIKEKLIGVNSASTFTGFCGYHDNEIFEPIERHSFQPIPEHALLLAYTSICRETFAKKYQTDGLAELMDFDRGLPPVVQAEMQRVLQASKLGAEHGLMRLHEYKGKLEAMLLRREYADLSFCIFLLPHYPEVLSSGSIYVEFDFDGNRLQPFPNRHDVLDSITFSVIATEKGGAVAFAWTNETRGACSRFIDSLLRLPREQLGDRLVRFLFTYCENTFFAPVWWDQLSSTNQSDLRRRAMLGSPFTGLPDRRCLQDDGLRFVNWRDAEVHSSFISEVS